ncbi:hypothetical protein Tco_1330557, partial [Tanacetum coccineum]
LTNNCWSITGCDTQPDWSAVIVINHYQALQITAGQSGCDTQPDVPTLTCAPGAHISIASCIFSFIPPLQQHNYEAPVVEQQTPAPSTQVDSGLVVPSFLPTDDPIARAINTVGDLKANPPIVISSRSGVTLHEEQHDFLADGFEEFDSNCDDLQLNTTSIFKADHVDAFDLDCDEAPTASAIFMARLSPAGSVNRDDAGLSYDSNILSEVPNYETYHETNMLNLIIHQMEHSEQLISVNDSHIKLTRDNNIISCAQYITTIENEVVQSVTSSEQDNAMIMFVIEEMKSQVERCNMVNHETKNVNESLTSELERYKEKLKFLEARPKSEFVFTRRKRTN